MHRELFPSALWSVAGLNLGVQPFCSLGHGPGKGIAKAHVTKAIRFGYLGF